MRNFGIDEMMNTTNSIYKLAVLTAKRAYELSQGANKLVEASLNTKFTTIALQEIMEKKITFKIKESK